MNVLDQLQDALSGEVALQSMYNRHMTEIATPEIRQLFMQMRDAKMQHVTRLQGEIKQLMDQGRTS